MAKEEGGGPFMNNASGRHAGEGTDYCGRVPYRVARNWTPRRMVWQMVAGSGHIQRDRGDSGIETGQS
jgi:hypothetical protein